MFDSGVGGLSVLDALRRRLPLASLFYIGDVAYAPYGERTDDDVIARSQRIVEHLVGLGARIVVVACNTATVLAIRALRQRWPEIAFVGVEPGVKPAVAATRTRRIAIMVTPATATSARMRHLVDEFAAGVHVHLEPCAGLAAAIERGALAGAELDAVLAPSCARVRAAEVDTVVLGCTHYPFVAEAIRARLGSEVTLIDTSIAVAERAAFISQSVADTETPAGLHIFSTGATDTMSALLQRCHALAHGQVEHLPISSTARPG